MCGRFAQFSPIKLLKESFDIRALKCGEPVQSYNVAPSQDVLAVIYSGERILAKLFWGLAPRIYKQASKPSLLINARFETIEEKPTFREAYRFRRCLIPADGFYEWEKAGTKKQPWFFTNHSGKPFAFAGIWENQKSENGTIYGSFVIITTTASEYVNPVHDRMPVILRRESQDMWLNPDEKSPTRLKTIIREGLINELKRYPVSRKINAVSNNDPSCIVPLSVPEAKIF